ncbi:hypothetical protein [Borrelia miyamotoi]|uniref:FhbA n=1 Tax=Borrelia miyamotoi TaxID=47466 RepID=A0A075BUA1_9SPIR|nr:hypothetical protein [Borrelia miyamotoi]AGS80215.1 FhbA [Borrelia miyamotoi]AOW96286.1 hypothetical protein AXH25_04725 [Borrelia miyamotoi]QTL84179.1 hypothetical protein bmLB2001_001100 [Borrelia miyamotoi]WAZ85828.1 hypothetical protein O5400_05625 [Borrelia miyamotoi]WAZ91610.1 hypothetical protein O5398_05625 [Borrelia miyamotoi]
MRYIKKYLLFILLLNLINCNLFNKNKNLDHNLQPNKINNIISSLDSNQKQALIFFKNLVKNKQYSKDLEQASKSYLENLKEKNNQNLNLQNKLNQGLNCDYDDSKIEKLFDQLGNDKMKKFLQQLHLMLKSINDGTLISFSSSNFRDTTTLSQKKEKALEYIKSQLYIEFYFHSNDISDTEFFFQRTIALLETQN